MWRELEKRARFHQAAGGTKKDVRRMVPGCKGVAV